MNIDIFNRPQHDVRTGACYNSNIQKNVINVAKQNKYNVRVDNHSHDFSIIRID